MYQALGLKLGTETLVEQASNELHTIAAQVEVADGRARARLRQLAAEAEADREAAGQAQDVPGGVVHRAALQDRGHRYGSRAKPLKVIYPFLI